MPLGKVSRTKMSLAGERRTARIAGGNRQPGSGSQWHSKADVRTPELLIERKDTAASQYTLKHDDLIKLRNHAARDGRMPAFVIGLCGKDYAVVDLQLLVDLIAATKEK